MFSWLAWTLLVCSVVLSNGEWYNHEKNVSSQLHASNLLEFDQLIDHINNTNLGTFKQRYYIDDTFYIPNNNSPLYLIIGGEGPISGVISAPMTTWAKQNHALLAKLEHRFYGTSFPYTGEGGYSLQSLKYLSVEQALADLKYFIESDIFIKNYSLNINSSKILFGCSYSGALSAWSKIKYPNIWTAIVSGSGVVNPLYEYSTYIQWGNMDFLKYSYNCYNNLNNAGSYIVNNLLITQNGREYLSEIFNICNIPSDDINSDSIQQLFYFLMQSLPVQIDNPSNNYPTQQLCNSLNTSNMNVNETLKIWSEWTQIMNKKYVISEQYNIDSCYNLSDYIGMYLIKNLKNTYVGNKSNWKSWAYQVCTEMGWFQTIHPGESALGVNASVTLKYLSSACRANGMGIIDYNGPNVDKLHNEYYGKQISSYISNAFFDYGHYDPWRWVTTEWIQPNNENVFLYEHDCAHCASFAKPSVDDSSVIKDERILIANWLSHFN